MILKGKAFAKSVWVDKLTADMIRMPLQCQEQTPKKVTEESTG